MSSNDAEQQGRTKQVPPLNMTEDELRALYSAVHREIDATWETDEDYEALESVYGKIKNLRRSVDTDQEEQ